MTLTMQNIIEDILLLKKIGKSEEVDNVIRLASKAGYDKAFLLLLDKIAQR